MPRKPKAPPTRLIVTLKDGSVTRKFVVIPEDEYQFADVADFKDVAPPHPLAHVYFGAQWLRRPGVIDEQSRSFVGTDVLSLKRGVA